MGSGLSKSKKKTNSPAMSAADYYDLRKASKLPAGKCLYIQSGDTTDFDGELYYPVGQWTGCGLHLHATDRHRSRRCWCRCRLPDRGGRRKNMFADQRLHLRRCGERVWPKHSPCRPPCGVGADSRSGDVSRRWRRGVPARTGRSRTPTSTRASTPKRFFTLLPRCCTSWHRTRCWSGEHDKRTRCPARLAVDACIFKASRH